VNGARLTAGGVHSLQDGDVLSFGAPNEVRLRVGWRHLRPPKTVTPLHASARLTPPPPPFQVQRGGVVIPNPFCYEFSSANPQLPPSEAAPAALSRRRARSPAAAAAAEEAEAEAEAAAAAAEAPAQRRRVAAPQPPEEAPPDAPNPRLPFPELQQAAYRAAPLRREPVHNVPPLSGSTLSHAAERMAADLCCSICYETMVAPHVLPCSHSFCGVCITAWAHKSALCPCCRERFSRPAYERALDELITAVLLPQLGPAEAAARAARREEWAALARLQGAEEAAAAAGEAAALRLVNSAIDRALAAAGAGGAERADLQRVRMGVAWLTGSGSGWRAADSRGGGGGGARARAPGGPADQPQAPLRWSVEYAVAASVCHACFRRVDAGDVRVVSAREGEGRRLRSFWHLACCAPPVSAAQLRGLEALRAGDAERVAALLPAPEAAEAAEAAGEGAAS